MFAATPVPVDVGLSDMPLSTVARQKSEEVFAYQLATRREKFRKFLQCINGFGYAKGSLMRGRLMKYYYALLRFPDDVGDGHHPLPAGFDSGSDYVQAKIAFARDPGQPKDAIDQVMLHCFQLAEQLGFSLRSETEMMLASIHFDAERQGKFQVCSKQELEDNFYRLDIEGTIQAALKIFGEEPELYAELADLGTASRKHYNLRDYDSETHEDGLINIPSEQMQEFDISTDNLHRTLSPGVARWFLHEAIEGLELLDRHTEKDIRLGWLARNTLKHVFANPAKKYFQSVLQLRS